MSTVYPAAARAGLRWLLEVDFMGATYRWTSDGESVSSDDGDLAVLGGLDSLSLAESLPIAGGAADRRSVSVTLQWPTTHAVEAAQGMDLSTAVGRLYLLAGTASREDGRLIVEGRLSEPIYGGAGEPVRTTLAGEPYDDAAQIPSALARISLDTWPDAAESALGRWYPIVWGRPGVSDGAGVIEGSPAYAVEHTGGAADTLLIAGHRVGATSVQVVYASGGGALTAESATVTEQADGLGMIVATVDVSGLSAALRAANDWTIRWSGSGAKTSPFRPGATLNTLGEIARWLAQESTIPQDRAAWAAVAQAYPWSSSGWVSEPASPMEILRDQILPALPVSLGWGRSGMRPIRWRYDAALSDAVEVLRAGEDCSRVEGVVYERAPEEIAQQIRVGYGGDTARRWVVLDGAGWSGGETSSSVYTRAAAQRWRTSSTRTHEVLSPAIWRRATAAQVALWVARVHGASPRVVEYDCGAGRAWLELGDVVQLYDSEISESQTLALVISRTVDITATVRLGLMLLPGWDSQARAVPAGASNDTPTYTST